MGKPNEQFILENRWLQRMLSQTSPLNRYDMAPWNAVIAGIWVVGSVAVAVLSLGLPTGLGILFGIVTAISLNTIAMVMTSTIIAAMLALTRLPMPRYAAGTAIHTGVIVYWILYYADANLQASLVVSVLIPMAGAATGWFVWAICSRTIHWLVRSGLLMSVAAGGLFLMYSLFMAPNEIPAGNMGSLSSDITFEDPSVPGDYDYQFFTYGSGRDLQRSEYGSKVGLVSSSVDASAYISKWPWIRKVFWGFDERQLPLNGRVWMPEGQGPFPLVLIVHGNHLMEYFSDAGYDYLGQLLASRGMIAVSIDENFLNYSVWSGIPDQDFKARAWVILKHIQQIESFAAAENTLFYGQVDLDQIALVGHSRGGQAAAMAADRDRWFASDTDLPDPGSYAIQAIASLAPTDAFVDGKRAELDNIYYLALQGAHDADVDTFYAARQYMRTTFSTDLDRFKAYLYIANANHGHFNTSWGSYDLSFPRALLLNRKDLLAGRDQTQITKVYVSAFLETVFHGQTQYMDLFRDYRNGLQALPDIRYYNRFDKGNLVELARFDHDEDTFKLSDGITIQSEGIMEQKVQPGGLELEWAESGTYQLVADAGFAETVEATEEIDQASLVFAMALPLPEPEVGDTLDPAPELNIELEDKDGETVQLPLDQFMPVQPLPETQYTWLPWLEEKTEVDVDQVQVRDDLVFQTYEVPLGAFQEENPRFSLTDWTRLAFHFNGGSNKVVIDGIGIDS